MMNSLDEQGQGCKQMAFHPNLFTIIHVDGIAFHNYLKDATRPFDPKFATIMNDTAVYLCTNLTGARLAFVQNNGIRIVLKRKAETDIFCGANVLKLVSLAVSLASAFFNRHPLAFTNKLALFDGNAFQLASEEAVIDDFIQTQYYGRNASITSVARSLYSHAQLQGKGPQEQLKMCQEANHPWELYDDNVKWGRLVIKESYEKETICTRKDVTQTVVVTRNRWIAKSCPLLKDNKELLQQHLK